MSARADLRSLFTHDAPFWQPYADEASLRSRFSVDGTFWSRFTEVACTAVVFAQDEARRMQSPGIRSGHLLLGLARECRGLAAAALMELDVDAPSVRREVERLVSHEGLPTRDPIEFEASVKGAFEMATVEADELGHHFVGTEHLLLALLSEQDCSAARVLAELGVRPQAIRKAVMRLIDPPDPKTA